MSWFPKYVSVATRRANAEKQMNKLRKKGQNIKPVLIEGRKISKTFWGKAWCEHIESFNDYENRLPRGRTYARNGSVCHLEIKQHEVKAIVVGSVLYNVKLSIKPIPIKKWESIKNKCQGKVCSVLELLAGKLSDGVMDVVCHLSEGLFPQFKEITLTCDCPDWAVMCKHVAAVLYGIGARLDSEPENLFTLRAVDHSEMVDISQAMAEITSSQSTSSKRLSSVDISSIFDFDMDESAEIRAAFNEEKKPELIQTPLPITGESLKKRRNELALTKTACAQLLNVSVSSITKWESFGKTNVVLSERSMEKLQTLWLE
mgnify:CR=1 FL=1